MLWIILFLALVLLFAWGLALRPQPQPPKGNWIVVDGSNVLHWEGNAPDLASVRHVVDILKSEGYDPLVWFDANVGYKIGAAYMGPGQLADRLGLSRRHVFVADKGMPADPLLLEDAEALGARVVTNDRYRDWEEEFPRIREAGFLVRGYIKADVVGLEWEK